MYTTSLAQSDGLVQLGKLTSFVCAVLMLLTGIVHIFAEFETWCSNVDQNATCAGPWLVFTLENYKFTYDVNAAVIPGTLSRGYRSVFSFEPDVFIRLWTPSVFGWIAVASQFRGSKSRLTASWMRVFWWHLFAAFFGVFGFAGGFGVICGFFLCPTACLLFLILALTRPGDDCCLDLTIGGTDNLDFGLPRGGYEQHVDEPGRTSSDTGGGGGYNADLLKNESSSSAGKKNAIY